MLRSLRQNTGVNFSPQYPLELANDNLIFNTVPGYFGLDTDYNGIYPMGLTPNTVLTAKGLNNKAVWETPGVYNGAVKTNFLSTATQNRFITLPNKSGEVALKSDLTNFVEKTIFSSNFVLIGLSLYQSNSLEVITLSEILGS